ncbi:MAG: addiction module protein [Thermaceae bacterium]|nr:addiction module protein [Thermaceae bacterium]
MSKALLEDALELPLEERLRLVQDLWDSIASEYDQLPVTDEERRELERRLALPREGRSWEEVKARLLDKK